MTFIHTESFAYYNPEMNYIDYKSLDFSAGLAESIESLIVPGLGQLSNGDYVKAGIFFGVEVISWGVYAHYNQRGIKQDGLNKEFADEYWSFSKWVREYYIFDDSLYDYIFENEETENFEDIWGPGHKLHFIYDDNDYTTGNDFKDFYDVHCPSQSCDDIFHPDSTHLFELRRNHNYYENIGKYDHFFAGWSDATLEEIYLFEKDSGEKIAMSSKKKKYRDGWEHVSELNKIADYALYTIYTNHIISLLDILVFSKINKNSKFNYRINTLYNPNNRMGIGGFKVSVEW